MPCFNFIWVVPISVLHGPEQVFQSEGNSAVSLNLIDVSHLVSNQSLPEDVVRVDVDCVPERCPAAKATQLHVPLDWPPPGLYSDHGIPDNVVGFCCASIFAAILASVAV